MGGEDTGPDLEKSPPLRELSFPIRGPCNSRELWLFLSRDVMLQTPPPSHHSLVRDPSWGGVFSLAFICSHPASPPP